MMMLSKGLETTRDTHGGYIDIAYGNFLFRSLHTCLLCVHEQDLRVIVASATLDAEQFRNFFETNRCADAA